MSPNQKGRRMAYMTNGTMQTLSEEQDISTKRVSAQPYVKMPSCKALVTATGGASPPASSQAAG